MKLEFSRDDLAPLVEQVVHQVLEEVELERVKIGDALTFSEAEAAALVGVPVYVLRDERLKREKAGECYTMRIGKKIRWKRTELLRFLGMDGASSNGRKAGRRAK